MVWGRLNSAHKQTNKTKQTHILIDNFKFVLDDHFK
jgi:hypothetical protein